ncbi:MAG: hypothetical protein ACNA8W_23565 [Bradymonadaceae bacterium]
MRRLSILGVVLLVLGCSDNATNDADVLEITDDADVTEPDAGEPDIEQIEDVAEDTTPSGEDDVSPDADVCAPTPSATLCAQAGAECGTIVADDGCEEEATIQCPSCDPPLTCGANGAENRCGVEGWEVSVVDENGDVGREVSMVLGPDGYPRVAYQATIGAGSELRFASFDGTDWTTEKLHDAVLAGKHTAIAYDSAGGLHVAATSFDGALLHSLDDGQWSSSTISPTARGRIGLAFNGESPHVCVHLESATLLVHYGLDEESAWASTTVDGSVAAEARYGNYCSIAVSPDGVVHIAYEDNQFRRLKYARLDGDVWSKDVADSEDQDFVGTYISLVLDSDGAPHISYRAGVVGTPSIRLTSWQQGQWQTRIVDADAGSIANFTSLAVDSSDGLHITYFDVNGGVLKYAEPSGAGWDVRAVAPVGDEVEVHSVIAVDEDGRRHIVFFDGVNRRLMYMRSL